MDVQKLVENLKLKKGDEYKYKLFLRGALKAVDMNQLQYLFDSIIYLNRDFHQLICAEYSMRVLKLMEAEQENILRDMIKRMEKESKYIFKIRLASAIVSFYDNKVNIPDDALAYLMSNSYYSIRKRGYRCLEQNKIDSFIDIIIRNHDANDDSILNLLLTATVTDKTKKILKKYLDYYNNQQKLRIKERIKRNTILIKLADFETGQIQGLKLTDPLSYIYIMKSIHQYVDTDYLYNLFYSFEYRKQYLLEWFGELGNYEVFERIANRELF